MDKMQILTVAVVTIIGVACVSAQGQQPRPSFSAGLTRMLNLTTPENVAYDKVFLDTSSAYDNSSGVYTVPVTGDYVVFLYGLAEYDGTLNLELYQNQQYVLSAYAHTVVNYGSASNMAVLQLTKGDQMHVLGKGSSILYGDPLEVYCTWTMYLLYARSANEQ